jgi:hypothetical protein
MSLPGGIEGIERLPPDIRAAALYRHLREIRATGVGPRLRLERAASLSPVVAETVNALMAQPVATSDRRLAISMPIALLKCRYDIERQAVVQSVRQPRADASLVADSILATFTALFDLLVCYWIQHLPPLERPHAQRGGGVARLWRHLAVELDGFRAIRSAGAFIAVISQAAEPLLQGVRRCHCARSVRYSVRQTALQ